MFSDIAAGDSGNPELDIYRNFALANVGDATAGEIVFRENRKAVCADCHRIVGMEKSGPNLDGIGEKYSRAELITHILEPSAFIKPGYRQANVVMATGRILNGRIERANKLMVRLLDIKGESIDVAASEIEYVRFSEVSLMPTNLVSAMSKEHFADLVAYLASLRFGVKNGLGKGGQHVDIPRLRKPIAFVPIHTDLIVFENPVWCSALPGAVDQLLVVEHQQARVSRYVRDPHHPHKELFVDLGSQVHIDGNQGLTSIALHPHFEKNGRYFLEHEVRENGHVKTTVVERRATADGLRDRGQESIRLLEVEQPANNHNGGCIAFGRDGMLYAGFGDGGPQRDPEGYSQNASELLGSFVRIDVDARDDGKAYAVPDDNPFLTAHRDDASIRPEVWAIGFREPWRFSFDSLTGDLWVGDVGQDRFEEICLVKRGENHGWNVREGFAPFLDEYRREGEEFADPLFAYEHGLGFSVTGGHVYRGDPESSFFGVYIFGDYNTRRVWGLRQKDGELLEVRELGTSPGGIASFGVDGRGEILLVTYAGQILHLDLAEAKYE